MAQVSSLNAAHVGRQRLQANNQTVSIPAALTTLLDIDVSLISRISLEVKNTGANAFTAFQINGKMDDAGDMVVMISAATHFTTPTGIIVDASGDLTVLGAGAIGWVFIDVLGLKRLQVRANSGTATTANVFAGGS